MLTVVLWVFVSEMPSSLTESVKYNKEPNILVVSIKLSDISSECDLNTHDLMTCSLKDVL